MGRRGGRESGRERSQHRGRPFPTASAGPRPSHSESSESFRVIRVIRVIPSHPSHSEFPAQGKALPHRSLQQPPDPGRVIRVIPSRSESFRVIASRASPKSCMIQVSPDPSQPRPAPTLIRVSPHPSHPGFESHAPIAADGRRFGAPKSRLFGAFRCAEIASFRRFSAQPANAPATARFCDC